MTASARHTAAPASPRAPGSRWRRCARPLAAGGCATGHPRPIGAQALAEAETFPYYRVYWVGPSFAGQPLAAADGQKGYVRSVGDSVYYGDCVHGKGIFGGGSCLLPLQVTTVIYSLHSNATLGPQRNILVRGVPATVYDEGRSIEIYSGQGRDRHLLGHLLPRDHRRQRAAAPQRARLGRRADLPPPVYCPGLSGADRRAAAEGDGQPAAARLPARGGAVAFANSLS